MSHMKQVEFLISNDLKNFVEYLFENYCQTEEFEPIDDFCKTRYKAKMSSENVDFFFKYVFLEANKIQGVVSIERIISVS